MSTYAFAVRSMAARHYNNLFALSLFTVCLFASTANADYDASISFFSQKNSIRICTYAVIN